MNEQLPDHSLLPYDPARLKKLSYTIMHPDNLTAGSRPLGPVSQRTLADTVMYQFLDSAQRTSPEDENYEYFLHSEERVDITLDYLHGKPFPELQAAIDESPLKETNILDVARVVARLGTRALPGYEKTERKRNEIEALMESDETRQVLQAFPNLGDTIRELFAEGRIEERQAKALAVLLNGEKPINSSSSSGVKQELKHAARLLASRLQRYSPPDEDNNFKFGAALLTRSIGNGGVHSVQRTLTAIIIEDIPKYKHYIAPKSYVQFAKSHAAYMLDLLYPPKET